MPEWYWLREDHSVERGPDYTDKAAFAVYSTWLYGETDGIPNHRIALTETATGLEVSTVFLGIDHSFATPSGSPIVFETMVFNLKESGRESIAQERYCTWNDAMKGHKELVAIYGGPIIPEPVTAQGARDYDEIIQAEELLNSHGK